MANCSNTLFCPIVQEVNMTLYILLLISVISFGESAIFYMKNSDRNDEPFNVEFFKLLGLKVDTNSDSLKSDLSKILLSPAESTVQGFGKNEQSTLQIPVKFSLAVDRAQTDFQSNVPDVFNFNEACKSLVGTSVSALCRLTQNYGVQQKKNLPRSCQEIFDNGINKSGIYEIHPRTSSKPFSVLCDMEIQGGGWTHIQKRFDGSQDFSLYWRDYKFGFGDLNGEFWIGLENIYHMTAFEVSELLIELIDRDQKKAYARYSFFVIGPEKEGYPLKNLTGFSGDAGDALIYHLGSKFTTVDVDQDENPGNCASMYNGAWWYKNCHYSNLNGKHMNKPLSDAYKHHGLNWLGFRGHDYNLAGSRMLVRPVGGN